MAPCDFCQDQEYKPLYSSYNSTRCNDQVAAGAFNAGACNTDAAELVKVSIQLLDGTYVCLLTITS